MFRVLAFPVCRECPARLSFKKLFYHVEIMMSKSPETFFLSSIYWQLFGGLTFPRANMSERFRLSMWFSFVRAIADHNRLHFKNVLWCLRLERGDLLGRLHFHFLIAGLPEQGITMGNRFAIRALWKSIGGGVSRIDLYDSRLHGLPYIAGLLGCSASDIGSGSMAYESAKFGAAGSGLMLSKSVEKLISANQRRSLSSLATLRTDGHV